MKLIRKVLRKIFYLIKGNPPTDEEIAARLIDRIKKGGGGCRTKCRYYRFKHRYGGTIPDFNWE